MKNLNINGTFREYVESIAVEIRRLLYTPQSFNGGFEHTYTIDIDDSTWGKAKVKDGGTRCKVISFHQNGSHKDCDACFSIAEIEFLTLQEYAPNSLVKLAERRLADVLEYVIELRRDNLNHMIGKLKGE